MKTSQTVQNLGRAVQLGQHRDFINCFSTTLNHDTLEAIAAAALADPELCAAFSIYFTTLEQAYAWPREKSVQTPQELHEHKLVIQMLYHGELSQLLYAAIESQRTFKTQCGEIGCLSLEIASRLLEDAKSARESNRPLPSRKQEIVNLLYRTCSQDWFSQGDYREEDCHPQFGRLHEIIRTNGTQRSVQEIFERTAISHLQKLPSLFTDMESADAKLVATIESLQYIVTLAREELFTMTIDEVIWGQTFAKFSKPVGYSTIGAGGADCPMFRMLDAVCGKEAETNGDILITELNMRSRHFPPTIRSLINRIASAPSLRAYIASAESSLELAQSFKVFQQLLWDLYEMHRKKAMRIVLSLRAGQLYTSSGTQNSTSPEWHISNTLKSAMVVRFGSDKSSRTIPASAVATPLLKNKDGSIEAVTIRLKFESPIVVAAGDALAVTVNDKDIGVQTRTYSITNTSPLSHKTDDSDGIHATNSVEVVCRTAGAVSNFLCSQTRPFSVKVALAPKPHFRIRQNQFSDGDTYFIAQNGAAQIFTAWLNRRNALVGSYTLIIGVRSLSSMSVLDSLLDARGKFGSSLRIIVAISQPKKGQEEALHKKGLEVFGGRVHKVLTKLRWNEALPTYVCGSSKFAVEVVKTLRRVHCDHPNDKHPRLTPIVTSTLPKLYLQVAAAPPRSTSTGLRVVSRAELAIHNAPGDLWIALNGFVYDISVLCKFHPGGEKTLLCRAGLEADDMFDSVHDGSFEVMSLLEAMKIGELEKADPVYAKRDEFLAHIVQTQDDLMNSSRFEQRATGCAAQLKQAPPSEIILGSISQFHKSWEALLRRFDSDNEISSRLTAAVDGFYSMVQQRRKRVYASQFWDHEACAKGLGRLFDTHDSVVQAIHDVIDGLKLSTAEDYDDVGYYRVACETATLKMIHMIESI